ncbi:hypothetical protein [Clostridium cellulovorans]|uniref:Uncharacterized protein n=1 Tax=Clostridium cellulovorans (strain ATCC 35296 / DSM 3052 / OCM 3 / 743B) TaxID=573061 RepID=D9SWJ3_CLOC7|nr:hypothetical protein [Clostridium cellulovorans]ADL53275.1 hypothetical protein Clocel_3602 [Clostridium cellulovorans 743B]
MEKTKKMPISISYGDFKTRASEFLVPNPYDNGGLIGIKSGAAYLYGAISYIGVEISTLDIIDKMTANGISIGNVDDYKDKLNKYIDEIYKYKISNVIEGVLDEKGNAILNKVANKPE